MPKVKIPRKSTSVDMTAMCDVSFLLLTFFILTSKFRPTEPVAIDVPISRSQITVTDAIRISVDKSGKAYINYPSPLFRQEVLTQMAKQYGKKYPYLANLTPKQINSFKQVETFGCDSHALSVDLNKGPDDVAKDTSGIPKDSTNNQLGDWIQAGRYADHALHPDQKAKDVIRIAIKGDKYTDVTAVKQVIKILTDRDIHTFNLITTLAGGAQKEESKQ
jgi:biopolymer transport protein ExbD